MCMLNSIALLTLFCIGFNIYAKRPRETVRQSQQYLAGGLLGVMAIGLMYCKIRQGDIVFDFRTVMLCLCGLFYGKIPATIATVMATLTAIFQGFGVLTPSALIAECTYTVAAGATGVLLCDDSRHWQGCKSIGAIASAGIFTQSVMMICVCIVNPSMSTVGDYAMALLGEMTVATVLAGVVLAMQINRHDISRQYKQLEDKYYKLILCNDDIFWEFDTSGVVTYVSDNVTQTLGYDREELIGRMPHFFVDDVQSVKLLTDYGSNCDNPDTAFFRQEIILRHKQGQNVYCDTRCMSIIDPATHRSSGFVCVTRNVTNSHLHKELSKHNQKFIREQTIQVNTLKKELDICKQRLIQANAEIADAKKTVNEAASKQMSAVSNICSEMTPVVDSITQYVTMLQDHPQDDAIKNMAIDQLLHSSEFLKTVSADLIDANSLAKGFTKLTLSIENIEDVLNEICDYHNSRNIYLLKKNILLQRDFRLKPDEKIIKADMQHFRRIVNLLLTNSYIFTSMGQITVECVRQSDSELLISITDTGLGIPEEALQTIFLPLSEQSAPPPYIRAKYKRQTGLGLNICKALVELMGGKIWIVSGIGKGTKVSFSMPFIKAGQIAAENQVQYNWQDYTAIVATSDSYSNILLGEMLAKTRAKYRCVRVYDDGSCSQPKSDYFEHYDIIITDAKSAVVPDIKAIILDNPSAATITIGDHPDIAAICNEIDQKLNEQNEN